MAVGNSGTCLGHSQKSNPYLSIFIIVSHYLIFDPEVFGRLVENLDCQAWWSSKLDLNKETIIQHINPINALFSYYLKSFFPFHLIIILLCNVTSLKWEILIKKFWSQISDFRNRLFWYFWAVKKIAEFLLGFLVIARYLKFNLYDMYRNCGCLCIW